MTEKAKVVKSVVFVDGTGEETRSPTEGSVDIKWTFADGSERIIHPNDLGQIVRHCALYHGVKQKLGDSYVKPSKSEDRDEYDNDPVGYSLDRFDAMVERLVEGIWVERAEAAGPRVTLLAEAVVRAAEAAGQPTSLEAATSWLKSKTDADRKSLTKDKTIAAMYAQIKAEKAAERAAKLVEEAEGAEFDFSQVG